MKRKLYDDLMRIRATGLSNMFAIPDILIIARWMGYWELADWIEAHKARYIHFILTGEDDDEQD